jgi:thiol:disulfide interchange protein
MTTTAQRGAGLLTLAFLAGLILGPDARAQGKLSDTVVKAKATADKPGADGKQAVTLTLTMDKGWYIYANPVGNADFEDNQTVANFAVKGKRVEAKVDYPAGEVVKDAVVGSYRIYPNPVTLKATVQRAKGDTSPLEVSIKVQACSKKGVCLQPSTIKLTVP